MQRYVGAGKGEGRHECGVHEFNCVNIGRWILLLLLLVMLVIVLMDVVVVVVVT